MRLEGFAIKGAKGRFGYAIRTYDDAFGNLYAYRDAGGIEGLVRAQSWEDAYGIVEDEFLPEAPTWEEMARDCDGCSGSDPVPLLEDGTPDYAALTENAVWCESFGFRPNGPNGTDVIKHGIYQKDLNGERLDAASPALLAELGWVVVLECDECGAIHETSTDGTVPVCDCGGDSTAQNAE